MLAIDWAHTKELVLYDGKTFTKTNRKGLTKYLNHDSVVMEQGAPISLSWFIFRKCPLYFMNAKKVAEYRRTNALEKSDEMDAMTIWMVAQNKDNIILASLDKTEIKLAMLYHLYLTYQKARIALSNQVKGAKRYYGSFLDNQLSGLENSIIEIKEKDLLKEIEKLTPKMPEDIDKIKGIGPRLWAGILCIANPKDFYSVNAYLKYCGLIDHKNINYNYNRDARVIYWLISDQIVKHRTPEYREFYDKAKLTLASKNPDWKPYRVNNAALNRLATVLAKDIYKTIKSQLQGGM